MGTALCSAGLRGTSTSVPDRQDDTGKRGEQKQGADDDPTSTALALAGLLDERLRVLTGHRRLGPVEGIPTLCYYD